MQGTSYQDFCWQISKSIFSEDFHDLSYLLSYTNFLVSTKIHRDFVRSSSCSKVSCVTMNITGTYDHGIDCFCLCVLFYVIAGHINITLESAMEPI